MRKSKRKTLMTIPLNGHRARPVAVDQNAECIVKVQLPMIGTATIDGTALVYAEGRSRTREQAIPKAARVHIKKQLLPKAFFNATFESGLWVIGEPVEDQGW